MECCVAEKTFHLSPPQAWAESAWRNLKLEPPADLLMITDYLGIRVVNREFATSMALGAYCRTSTGRAVIIINKCIDSIPRKRWTLAHEIGHHLLSGNEQQSGRICIFGIKQHEADSQTERQANQFAAELLMPYWLVKEWFDDLAGNPFKRVAIMADRFGVSLTAMRYRLKELKLGNGLFQNYNSVLPHYNYNNCRCKWKW